MPKRPSRGTAGRAVIAAVGGAVALGLTYLAVKSATSDPVPGMARALDARSLGDRILVIAPHPDDETIVTGGLIRQARAEGAEVKVVLMTVGDGYRRAAARLAKGPVTPARFLELGRLRREESSSALDVLGVPPDDRVYLAYSDGSLNSLWALRWDPNTPHVGANHRSAVPYEFARRPGATYCGASVAQDLEDIIREFGPTAVVYPDPDDRHHDHWATAAFCDYAMEAAGFTGGRYTYVAHFLHYPFPWAHLPRAYVSPPSPLLDTGTAWHSIDLPAPVQDRKRTALESYRTQMRVPDLRVYLEAFDRRNELFGTCEPRLPGLSPADTPPLVGSHEPGDRVVVQPDVGIAHRALNPPGAIKDVRLVRGPTTLWMGVRTFDATTNDLRYDFHLRLFGGTVPGRLDVAVGPGGDPRVVRDTPDSIDPGNVDVVSDGDTVWIGMPSSVIAGRTSCMAGAETHPGPSEWVGSRSAWRVVRLK
jgi:N-acetyl-1-D-myo-inositol-2-amino-2-deoxy-alpha-D-glucopyranoside deacetylase